MNAPHADRLTLPQRAAVAKLACGCESAGGVALLCGPAGAGKTTVLAALAAAGGTGRTVGLATAQHWVAAPSLPDIVLADDAHEADGIALARLLRRCSDRTPGACLVLAGAGRLFTLAARDPRLEQAIRIRVTLPCFTAAETRTLFAATVAGINDREIDVLDSTARVVHEIAAGLPAAVVRLAGLAAVIVADRPDEPLAAADIEAIHERLSLAAA
jgi:type II secretory pathway predicted ATPase ExeA